MEKYNDIEWLWIQKVLRVDETHIDLVRERLITTYEFDTAAECLKDFLYLKKKWRNQYGKKRENESESKSSERLFNLRKRSN